MEASWAPNGKVRLELPLSNFLLLNWALWTTGAALEWDEKWFRELTGLSPAQVRALNDELTIVRLALEGSPRFISAVTGELRPPLEPSKTGTAAWDDLPDIEAENLPGRMVVVTLPLEKLAVISELFEASLVYVAPYRSAPEERNFGMRFQASTKEFEELRDEFRLLCRELRLKLRAPESDDKETSRPLLPGPLFTEVPRRGILRSSAEPRTAARVRSAGCRS
jgi:hypothetical protein